MKNALLHKKTPPHPATAHRIQACRSAHKVKNRDEAPHSRQKTEKVELDGDWLLQKTHD